MASFKELRDLLVTCYDSKITVNKKVNKKVTVNKKVKINFFCFKKLNIS